MAWDSGLSLIPLGEEKKTLTFCRGIWSWWPSCFWKQITYLRTEPTQEQVELREARDKTEPVGHCLGSECSHPWKQILWILQSCEPIDSFSYAGTSIWVRFLSLATQRSLTNIESHSKPKALWVFGRLEDRHGVQLPQHLARLPVVQLPSIHEMIGPKLCCFQRCRFLFLGSMRF